MDPSFFTAYSQFPQDPHDPLDDQMIWETTQQTDFQETEEKAQADEQPTDLFEEVPEEQRQTGNPLYGPEWHALGQTVSQLSNPAEREALLDQHGLAVIEHIPEPVQHPMNHKLFALIHGDRLIKDTKLQGGSVGEYLALVIKIASFHADEDSQPFIDDLRHLADLQNKIGGICHGKKIKNWDEDKAEQVLHYIIDAIRELPFGEFFLFPGGWNSISGGHAIIIEIQRMENDYTLRIVNTGAGLTHHTDITVLKKKYANSIFTIKNISQGQILAREFWKIALDLRLTTYPGNKEATSDDIYKKLVLLLGGTIVEEPYDLDDKRVTPQESGTCSIKSLNAYIKFRLGRFEGQKLIHAVKFWSIANYLKNHHEPKNYTQNLLLKKAVHGLSNLANKIRGPQDLSLFAATFALSRETLKAVKQIEASLIEDKFLGINQDDYLLSCEKLDAEIEKLNPLEKAEPQNEIKINQKKELASAEFETDDLPPFKREHRPFLQWAQEWVTFSRKALEKKRFNLLVEFQQMLECLDIPNFNLPPVSSVNNLKRAFNLCIELGDIYKQIMEENENSKNGDPEFDLRKFVDVTHIYMLMDAIAVNLFLKAYEIDLLPYGLYVPFYEELFNPLPEKPKRPIADLQLQSRLQKLQTYINLRNDGKEQVLFDYPFQYLHEADECYLQVSSKNESSFADLKLLDSILESKELKSEGGQLYTLIQHFIAKKKSIPEEYYQLRKFSFFCRFAALRAAEKHFSFHVVNFDVGEETTPSDLSFKISLRKAFHKKRDHKFGIEFDTTGIISAKSNRLSQVVKSILFENLPQNQIRQIKGKSSHLSDFEVERLHDIRQANHTRILLLMNYYEDQPLFLLNPSHLQFFSYTMLENGFILEGLSNHLSERACSFFNRVLSQFNENNPDHRNTLLEILEIGLTFLSNGIPEALNPLKRLLKDKITKCNQYSISNIEDWRCKDFFVVLCRAFALETDLKTEEIQFLLTSIHQHSKSTHLSDWISPQTYPLIQLLKKELSDDGKRNQLFSSLTFLPPIPFGSSGWNGAFPIYQQENWIYNILSGSLTHPHLIPFSDIKSFKFSNCYFDQIVGEDFNQHFKKEGTNYISEDGAVTILISDDNHQKLVRKIGNENYIFVLAGSDLKKICFENGKWEYDPQLLVWSHETSGKMLITNLQLQIIYTLERRKNSWIVRDINQKVLIKPTPTNIPTQLKPFLDLLGGSPLVWINEQMVIDRIELDNFDLILEREGVNFNIKGMNGFIIAPESPPMVFANLQQIPFIKDRNGKIFAFVPTERIAYQKRKIENNELQYALGLAYDGYENNPQTKYYLYEYDQTTQSLCPDSSESTLFLACLYFSDDNIPTAHRLLLECYKKTSYNREEHDLILNVLKLDENIYLKPLQYAFLVRLIYMIFQNVRSDMFYGTHAEETFFGHSKPIPKYAICYIRYLSQLGAIPLEYQLSIEEEKQILSYLLHQAKTILEKDFPTILLKLINRKSFIEEKNTDLPPVETKMGDFPLNLTPKGNVEYDPTIFQDAVKEAQPFDYRKFFTNLAKSPIKGSARRKETYTDPEILLSLWLGFLTEDPEISTAAAGYLFFAGEGKQSKIPHYFMGIFLTRIRYRFYLKRKYSDRYLDNPHVIINEYPNFLESFKKQYKVNTADLFRSLSWRKVKMDSPFFTSDLSYDVIKNETQPIYHSPAEPQRRIDGLEYNLQMITEMKRRRHGLLSTYLKKIEHTQSAESIFSVEQGSRAERLLKTSPLAMELSAYFSDEDLSAKVAWDFEKNDTAFKEQFQKDLQQLHDWVCETKTQLADGIDKLANITPFDREGSISAQQLIDSFKRNVQIFAGKKRHISQELLVNLLLNKRWDILRDWNPNLTTSDLETLKIHTILLLAVELEEKLLQKAISQLNHIVSAVDKIDEESEEEKTHRLNQLAIQLSTERHYRIENQTDLLAFENLMKIHLRENQAKHLLGAINSDSEDYIINASMGEGKSKIIRPYLAKEMSTKHSLVVIIVTDSMYNQELINIQRTSEHLLGQKIYPFKFDRDSLINKDALMRIDSMLKQIIREESGLLATPESLQALLLKYEELLIKEEEFQAKENASSEALELSERRFLLGNIIECIRTDSVAIIDEGHVSLSTLQEVNFTLGSGEPIDVLEYETIIDLFKALLAGGIDLTKPIEFKSSPDRDPTCQAMREVILRQYRSEPEYELILKYLTAVDPGAIDEINRRNPLLASKMALIKEMLWNFLPFTLAKGLDLHYGRSWDADIEYAIPYVGNRKPSLKREFGNQHVMLNFTVQMHLQEGLKPQQFKTWLQYILQTWTVLDFENPEEASTLLNELLDGLSIKNVDFNDQKQLCSLYQKFHKRSTTVLHYLSKILFPSLKYHTKKLNSNSLDIGDFLFSRTIVLSGTPYNKNAFPVNMSLIPIQPTEEERRLIQTLRLRRNRGFEIVDKGEPGEVISHLQRMSQKEKHLLALVDLAAFFRGIENQKVAVALLKSLSHIDGVVFFDDKLNELVVLKKDQADADPIPFKEGMIIPDRLFAYFDNVHTFAADIHLHHHAKAVVTVSSNDCLFQILQADKRMRQLELGQSLCHMITRSTGEQMRDLTSHAELSIEDLLFLGAYNQVQRVEKEIFTSVMHQFTHAIKGKYLHAQLQSRELIGSPSSILVDELKSDPYAHYRHFDTLYSSKNYFTEQSRLILARMDVKNPEIEQVHQLIIEQVVSRLPKRIHLVMGKQLNQEVQKQEEKKKEQGIQRAITFEAYEEAPWEPSVLSLTKPLDNCDIKYFYTDQEDHNLILFRLNDFLGAFSIFKDLFDVNLFVTKNFIKTAAMEQLSWTIPFKPADSFLIRAFRSVDNPDQWFIQTLLFSVKETENVLTYLSERSGLVSQNLVMILFDIKGRWIAGDQIPKEAAVKFQEKIMMMQVQLRLFNGEDRFSKEQEGFLFSFVAKKEEAMKSIFHLLRMNRRERESFGSGNLFAILKQSKQIHDPQRFAGGPRLAGMNASKRKTYDSISGELESKKKPRKE